MARFFKRRAQAKPNKNEAKVRRGRETPGLALGLRFPAVSRLAVELSFVSPQNEVFDKQSRVFARADSCDLSVSCPGRCGLGSFDLAAKVQAVVEARQTQAEASGTCQEPLYAGSPDVCGFKLQCRIEIAYSPEVPA